MTHYEDEFRDMHNINLIRRELRRDALSIKNRLQSIIHDRNFVRRATGDCLYPLVPNERCGLWYVAPHEAADSAYFKSTDGHTGEWQFSMRRLNLHLVPKIKHSGGVVIVDSTRKGKTMPDALLKTVPIWCAVLNSIAFEGTEPVRSQSAEERELVTGLQANNWLLLPSVAGREQHQVARLVPQMVAEVKRLGLVRREQLGLEKPLLPQWVHPGARAIVRREGFYNVVCVTASARRDGDSRISVSAAGAACSWQYIQGAADDHELWVSREVCDGRLDAATWWSRMYYDGDRCNERLIDSATGYIHEWMADEAVVAALNAQWAVAGSDSAKAVEVVLVAGSGIRFGKILRSVLYAQMVLELGDVRSVVVLSSRHTVDAVPDEACVEVHQVRIESSKKGSKALRRLLPELVPRVTTPAVVVCDTGTDLSVGVVLALLCQRFNLRFEQRPVAASKDLVKQFLSEINAFAKVNPSRNTLQSVNSFLM